MRNVDKLNASLDKIRENPEMFSFSGCHFAKNLKLTASGNLEVTLSIPADQLGCTDLRELDANNQAYDNLKMLPVIVFVQADKVKAEQK